MPLPSQPALRSSTVEEDSLTMDPSTDEEAQLLEHFNRYMSAEDDASPDPTPDAAPEPANTPSPRASNPTSSSPLERLKTRYPNCDHDVLRDVLHSVEQDEEAATVLLGDSPVGNQSNHTQADGELALRLQRMETERHRRNDAIVPLRQESMRKMIATLREIVVPALRAHFQELVLPDKVETTGSVVYALKRSFVSALALPTDNIVVKAAPSGKAIMVNILNAFLEFEVEEWSYESKGYLSFKDSGQAKVVLHGLNVAIKLEPRWSYGGGTNVTVADCEVTVDGVVRFKTEGATATWAYNIMIMAFKPLVVSYIKEAIADTVTRALAVHLNQWAITRSLDEDSRPTLDTNATTQAPVVAE